MRTPIKFLPNDNKEIYATFDDGPCPQTTELVLNELAKLNIKATFFVIGEAAQKNRNLILEIVSQGHAIGNHSWDHRYAHYFKNQNHLKNWVLDSQKRLSDLLGLEPVGFRSPAGIVTPPLQKAMEEVDLPWVHWNRRFFDTNVPLAWLWSCSKIQQGDILLLHDRQKKTLARSFLSTMASGFAVLQDKGFDFQPLSAEKFTNAC